MPCSCRHQSKTMTILLFCPPKILLHHSAREWREALGPDAVILTCASQKDSISKHFSGDLSCHFFDRFNDSPEVELRAVELARRFNAPKAVALAEIDMLRSARVNDYLGVTANSEARLLYFRDKFLMKSRAAEHGLKVAPMAIVHSALDIRRFVDAHAYPVVLKPRDGRGSNNVAVIRNGKALGDWLAQQAGSTFYNTMIERYVVGEHYIVNGLYIEGKAIFISPVKVMTSALDFLGGACHDLHMLNDSNPVRTALIAYSRRLVEQVLPGDPTMLFHLEVFIDEGGEIVLCEIASRLGGVFFNQELHEAWGIDPRMTYLKAMRGKDVPVEPIEMPVRQVGHISIPPNRGVLRAAPSECTLPFVRRYKMYGKAGQEYKGMEFTNSEIVSAIVEGSDEREIETRLRAFQAWFAESTTWDLHG